MIVTRYKFIKIILMILFPLNQIFAQNIDFKSSNFKSDKEGFKQAIKDIKLGDEYLEKGNEAIFARTAIQKRSALPTAVLQIQNVCQIFPDCFAIDLSLPVSLLPIL